MATKKPIVYRDDLGYAGTPAPGDTIDPVYLPAVAAPTQRTFAYWAS